MPFHSTFGRRLLYAFIAFIMLTGLWMCKPREESYGTIRLEKRGIRVAVLGDSDSHAYDDPITGVRRGGEYHQYTYQWTDVLATLRQADFDFGEKGVWGTRKRYAVLKEWLGFDCRTPPKYDYRYNYALSGLHCDSLLDGWPEQARWLIDRIKHDPMHWMDAVVVIRIGINDLGQLNHLEEYAKTGTTPEVRQRVETCVKQIADAVRAIRRASATIRIVLVGIADNSSLPLPVDKAFDSEQLARIRSVQDLFDNSVRKVAEADGNAAFMEDRQWLERLWSNENTKTPGAVSQISLGGRTGIRKTKGDNPANIILSDGHASTVVNGLWARELIHKLNDRFGLGIAPLLDEEIAILADPRGEFGIASRPLEKPPSPTFRLPYSQLQLNWDQLPMQLPAFEALDGRGRSITQTAVAYTQDTKGTVRWLFSDGPNLEIGPDRFQSGAYQLTLQARDAWGQIIEQTLDLVIDGKN